MIASGRSWQRLLEVPALGRRAAAVLLASGRIRQRHLELPRSSADAVSSAASKSPFRAVPLGPPSLIPPATRPPSAQVAASERATSRPRWSAAAGSPPALKCAASRAPRAPARFRDHPAQTRQRSIPATLGHGSPRSRSTRLAEFPSRARSAPSASIAPRGSARAGPLTSGVKRLALRGHHSVAFLHHNAGRDFVVTMERIWRSQGCLDARSFEGADGRPQLIHAAFGTPVKRARPGSYAWPRLGARPRRHSRWASACSRWSRDCGSRHAGGDATPPSIRDACAAGSRKAADAVPAEGTTPERVPIRPISIVVEDGPSPVSSRPDRTPERVAMRPVLWL